MNAATAEFHALKVVLFFILWPATFTCLGVRYGVARSDTPSTPLPSRSVDQTHRSWHIGGFVAGGFPPAYEIHDGTFRFNEELNFFNAGAIAGKTLTDPHGPGFLRGRGEAVVEVIPYWLAHYPKQTLKFNPDDPSQFPSYTTNPAYSNHGVSITPLLFRWNFEHTESGSFVPWFQLGSGLLWTVKFSARERTRCRNKQNQLHTTSWFWRKHLHPKKSKSGSRPKGRSHIKRGLRGIQPRRQPNSSTQPRIFLVEIAIWQSISI
jgi:hypothetical protein